MTRDNDRDGILRKCLRYIARQTAIAEPRGNFTVGDRLPRSNGASNVVDTAIEVRHAVEVERHGAQVFRLTIQQSNDVGDNALRVGWRRNLERARIAAHDAIVRGLLALFGNPYACDSAPTPDDAAVADG